MLMNSNLIKVYAQNIQNTLKVNIKVYTFNILFVSLYQNKETRVFTIKFESHETVNYYQ